MRSISYQMHTAKFPVHRDLAGFDFECSPVDKKLIEQLASMVLASSERWAATLKRLNVSFGLRCLAIHLTASGRVEPKQASSCSPQTGHPADSNVQNFEMIATGR